jgi:hypothetical protein
LAIDQQEWNAPLLVDCRCPFFKEQMQYVADETQYVADETKGSLP